MFTTTFALTNTCGANTCADIQHLYEANDCCDSSKNEFISKNPTWAELPAAGTLIKGFERTTIAYQATYNETTGKVNMAFGAKSNPPMCYNQIKSLAQGQTCRQYGPGLSSRRLIYYHLMGQEYFWPDLLEEVPSAPVCDGDVMDDGYLKNPSPTNCKSTLKLRQGIKWSDGQPITAHDYTYYDHLVTTFPGKFQAGYSYNVIDDYTLELTEQTRNKQAMNIFSGQPYPRHFWTNYESSFETLTSDLVPLPPTTTHVMYDAEKTIWPDKSAHPERLVFKVDMASPAYRERYWRICWDTFQSTLEEGGVIQHFGGGCPSGMRVLEGPHVEYISYEIFDDYKTGIPLFNSDYLHIFSNAFMRQGIGPDNTPFDGNDFTNNWERNWAWNQDAVDKVITGDFKLAGGNLYPMMRYIQYNLRTWPGKSLAFRQAMTCLVDKRKETDRKKGSFTQYPVFGTSPTVPSESIPTYAERLCFGKNKFERHLEALHLLKNEGWTADNWNEASTKPTKLSSEFSGIANSLTEGYWGILPPTGLKAPDGTPASDFANEFWAWDMNSNEPIGELATRLMNQLGVPTTLLRIPDVKNVRLLWFDGLCGNYSSWRQSWKDKFERLPKWSGAALNGQPGSFNVYSSETYAFGDRYDLSDTCHKLPTRLDWDGYGANTSYAAWSAQNVGWSDPELDRLNDYFRLYDYQSGGKTEEYKQKKSRQREITSNAQLITTIDAQPNAATLYRNAIFPDDDWEDNFGPFSDNFVKITNANGKSWNADKPSVQLLNLEPTDYGVIPEGTLISPPPPPPPVSPVSGPSSGSFFSRAELINGKYAYKLIPGTYTVAFSNGVELPYVVTETDFTFVYGGADRIWTYDAATGYYISDAWGATYKHGFFSDTCTSLDEFVSGCGIHWWGSENAFTVVSISST